MNYELAKELRDAGFPQLPNDLAYEDPDSNIWIRKPTLEELIEACGERFGGLVVQSRGENDSVAWAADAMPVELPDGTVGRIGSTPSEAVARLWLALNKHV